MSTMKNRLSWLLVFLAGFILGPLGDFTHILSQTTGYPQGAWGSVSGWPIPLWVPWEFGLATVAVALTHFRFDSILARPPTPVEHSQLPLAFIGLFGFLGQWALSGYLPGPAGGSADAVMFVYALGLWLLLDRRWQGIATGALVAVSGTLIEIALVNAQVFSYHAPKNNFWGVPSWLPWLYFSASTAIGYFARMLAAWEKRRLPEGHQGIEDFPQPTATP